MPNKLIMKCVGGPYGDCTSSYEFTLTEQMTLKEFAEMVAADGEEWGAIRKGSSFGDVLVEYNRSGEIEYRDYADPNAILELKGTAHGGWSLMDYHVNIDKNAKAVSNKKQYWISLEHNFKRRIILFENGEPTTYYESFVDEVAEFIEQIESEGYVKGFLQEDLDEARIVYERVKDNVLPIGYKELWELEEKMKNENNKTTMS